MFVQVKLLNGFERPLLYHVPESLKQKITKNSIINVPLRNNVYKALVLQTLSYLNKAPTFSIKDIKSIDPFPKDQTYHAFIKQLSQYSFSEPLAFYQRIRHSIDENPLSVEPLLKEQHNLLKALPKLTDEQEAVVQHVNPFINNAQFKVTVLQGVTGSGKTEVYKRLIQSCIEKNKSVILMIPEVSLSLQFERLLQKQLPLISILGFHSASKPSEKRTVWAKLCNEEPLVIIGVHQPILLPIANLGLILVDEEHEQGFQEKKHPKINSRDIAILRSQNNNIPILLGSATPSLATLANIEHKGWSHFLLKKRFSGSFPLITKVSLISKDKKDKRRFFWITKELELAITDSLSRKEQVIIYLNRRGYNFFTLCKQCSHTFTCTQCSVNLTPHTEKMLSTPLLRCHYCDFQMPQPNNCPSCQASAKNFLRKGVGTQQIVEILQQLFPQAVIARADLDTTRKKKLWADTVEQFSSGDIDILVGTKTITKGYHFPNVTLVGIIWADLNVHMPVYNAGESSLQQLIQVAGRTGRGKKASRVVMQVMQEHPIFDFIDETTYPEFAKQELSMRKTYHYPPYNRMLTIEIRHAEKAIVEKDAATIATALRTKSKMENITARIMGPALPPVSRIKNSEIRHIIIKSPNFRQATLLLRSIKKYQTSSSVFIIPNC